jgi:hypothetical protein
MSSADLFLDFLGRVLCFGVNGDFSVSDRFKSSQTFTSKPANGRWCPGLNSSILPP